MNNVNISDFSINMKATGKNIVHLMNEAGITVRMLQLQTDSMPSD